MDPYLVLAVRVLCVLIVLYAGEALWDTLREIWKGERR